MELSDWLLEDRLADVAVLVVVLGMVDDRWSLSSVNGTEWKVRSDGSAVNSDMWMERLSKSVCGSWYASDSSDPGDS